jgi:hypothetical protein
MTWWEWSPPAASHTPSSLLATLIVTSCASCLMLIVIGGGVGALVGFATLLVNLGAVCCTPVRHRGSDPFDRRHPPARSKRSVHR